MRDILWTTSMSLSLLLGAMACGDDAPPPASDGAPMDSRVPDSSRPDASPPTPDAAAGDASIPDGSPADASEMEAGAPPDAAGGCMSNRDCRPRQFCEASGCEGPGLCEVRPEACTEEYDPVCGCDAMTYGNDCARRAAGVRFRSRGECSGGELMCDRSPRATCCFDDDDCRGPTRCVNETCSDGGEGVCKPISVASGQCWEDSDCRAGTLCEGEVVCPCAASCIVPDRPGHCGAS